MLILYKVCRCTVCNVDMKDGKNTKPFLMAGKGKYVGESSRSMNEQGKEHQKDRADKSEDSHQVKHWLMEQPEMKEPPTVQVPNSVHF